MDIEKVTFNEGLGWTPSGNPDTVMNADHENGNGYIKRVGGMPRNNTGGYCGSGVSCYSGVF